MANVIMLIVGCDASAGASRGVRGPMGVILQQMVLFGQGELAREVFTQLINVAVPESEVFEFGCNSGCVAYPLACALAM